MPFKWVWLSTDVVFWALCLGVVLVAYMPKPKHISAAWARVWESKVAMGAVVVMLFYVLITLLDSVHLSFNAMDKPGVYTFIDLMFAHVEHTPEWTYSAPFAQITHGPTLLFQASCGFAIGAMIWGVIVWTFSRFHTRTSPVAWRSAAWALFWVLTLFSMLYYLSFFYHVFGTDKVGQDVFYQSIKSVRTGVFIGTVTTLVLLPFAMLMGTLAGYFGGVVDDVIQYIYTTISSIPNVLLIVASVLMLEIFMTNHPEFFSNMEDRAEARLLALCIILGITSWTSLCRLLRAETLKLREQDYVKAGISLGSSNRFILWQHIVPNLMHIIFITVALDFSSLVLMEAVLAYVGVGVDAMTFSWGNMINAARLELARDPVVWWSLTAAFILMFALVLAANLLSDVVQKAFDPRARQEGS